MLGCFRLCSVVLGCGVPRCVDVCWGGVLMCAGVCRGVLVCAVCGVSIGELVIRHRFSYVVKFDTERL